MLSILGTATRSVVNLNRWLAERDCPQYAGLYAAAGNQYGVRWDVAVFQSIHETAWFRFGGDVSASQHNYAGIGASGGGVPGDSFPTAAMGITAQIQNLALRAGVGIPRDTIIAPYVRRHYDLISNRNTKTWESLTGTWATDTEYTNKIFRIMAEYDAWESEFANPDVTWIELNRTAGGDTVCVAYAGDRVKAVQVTNDKVVIVDFLNRYPGAQSVRVAPAGKPVPGIEDYNRGETPPAPTGGIVGRKITLCAGHSEAASGASGIGPNGPKEWLINRHQMQTAARILRAAGAIVTEYDPAVDNLEREGMQAAGQDLFLVFHNNAAESAAQGTETFTYRETSAACTRAARMIQAAMVMALRLDDRGVKTAGYTVLRVSETETDCPINILTESFFLHRMTDADKAMAMGEKAAEAVADAIIRIFA